MSGKATKAASSVWYKARMRMAEKDSRFCSREIASIILGIERTRLAHIELQDVLIHPDEAVVMADKYKAPELLNYCCTKCCPIGVIDVEPVEVMSIEKIAVRLLRTLGDVADIEKAIIEIAAKEKVTEDEIRKLNEILEKLKRLAKIKNELAVYLRRMI